MSVLCVNESVDWLNRKEKVLTYLRTIKMKDPKPHYASISREILCLPPRLSLTLPSWALFPCTLYQGKRVIVRGTTKADANGKVGTANRYDEGAGRYASLEHVHSVDETCAHVV